MVSHPATKSARETNQTHRDRQRDTEFLTQTQNQTQTNKHSQSERDRDSHTHNDTVRNGHTERHSHIRQPYVVVDNYAW